MNTKKEYCSQNEGDCSTCSLVSYGRDCQNNPLDAYGDAQAVESITVEPMTRQHFEHEMSKAKTMQGLDTDKAEYWTGYQRGLRRAFHDETFGTPAEHELWLAAVNDDDTMRQQRGQGYREGLAGKPLTTQPKGCILKS